MYNRKILFKCVIIGMLGVLPFVILEIRKIQRSHEYYVWYDTPGQNIKLPEDVSGPFGFFACFSPSGDKLVVVGNEIMSQETLEEKVDPVFMMMALRYSFHISDAPEYKNFQEIYRSDYPGIVYDMACSPILPNHVAFIASTVQVRLPKSPAELHSVTNDPDINSKTQREWQQVVKDGCRTALFLLDMSSGEIKELTCIWDRHPLRQVFSHKGVAFLSWTHDGEAIIYSDRDFVWHIQPSGEKKQIFSLNGGAIFSNIRCEPNGDILFVFLGTLEGEERVSREELVSGWNPRMVQIDSTGKLLSKTRASFYPGTYEFECPMTALIGKNRIATIKMNNSESMYPVRDFTIGFFSVNDVVNNKNVVDPVHKSLLFDRNYVQFYYQPLAFSPDEKTVYFVKKRATVGSDKDYTTPMTMSNILAPWVEFRKIKCE